MTLDANVGYYMVGHGNGGAHGPKEKPSSRVHLIYPTSSRKQTEKAFELLRYHDPTEQDSIYITRFDPSNIVWGRDDNSVPVPATPELHKVFDEYVPLWEREREAHNQRYHAAFEKARVKAGLTWDDAPEWPENGTEEEKQVAAEDYNRNFYDKVIVHMEPVKPLLVKVEGIDAILDSMEITPMTKR